MKLLDDLKAKLTPKTPAERERLKKIGGLYAADTLVPRMPWLIFAPSGEEETVKGKANMELPEQTSEGLPETKMDAYEQGSFGRRRRMTAQ